ncbi:MAG: hypothetical protein QRY71_04525 [Candidatus Rhabdochlamydia sp.]
MQTTNYILPAVTLTSAMNKKEEHTDKAASKSQSKHVSREDMMQMIYALLLLVGVNMSKVQNLQSSSQIDSTEIAEAFAQALKTNTQNMIQNEQKQEAAQQKESKWSIFATVVKWVCLAAGALLTLLTGGLAGCIVFGLVMAFTMSPLFNKTVSAISDGLEHLGLGSTAANIIAQIAVTIVLTVVTCGAEGLANGLSGIVASATEDSADVGIEMTDMTANRAANEPTEIEEVEGSMNQNASEETDESTHQKEESSTKKFTPKWTLNSVTALMSGLANANLIDELIGLSSLSPTTAAIIAASIQIFMCAVLLITAPAAETQALMNLTEGTLTKLSIGVNLGTGGATATAGVGTGYYLLQEGNLLKDLAPLQGEALFLQQLMTAWSKLSDQGQKTFKSEIATNQTLMNTNFSADLQAAVIAQQTA